MTSFDLDGCFLCVFFIETFGIRDLSLLINQRALTAAASATLAGDCAATGRDKYQNFNRSVHQKIYMYKYMGLYVLCSALGPHVRATRWEHTDKLSSFSS